MTKVLVTGAAGFIGRHVVAALGDDAVGIDTREADLRDRFRLIEQLRAAAPAAIVHLGARTDLGGQSLADYAANTDGVANLISAIDSTPSVERCLFASSQLVCKVGYVPRDEHDTCADTQYGKSKVLGEEIVRAWNSGRVTWCLLRPTTIWGPGMGAHYQRFLRMIERGRYVHVGRRPLYKSYGYVGNAVHQIRRFLSAPSDRIHGRTFYLADYQALSLRGWAEAIQRELGAAPIRTIPEPAARSIALAGDVVNRLGWSSFPFNSFRLRNVLTEYQFDLRATEEICGPLPYSMNDGVRALVAWFRTRS
jgi:nucleoside-diphosphate-sugar epimerase